jgi:hypothetical protein
MALFQGQVGVVFKVKLGVSLVSGGTVGMRVVKPDGTTVVTWAATISNAASGEITYTTVAGDLDQVGDYVLNGVWDPAGDDIHYGEPACFTVDELGVCND